MLLADIEWKGEYIVRIEKAKAKRSLDQNAYYWFYLKLVSDSCGHTPQELHEIFKRLFIPPKIIKWKKTTIKTPGSTSDLNKPQFGEYLDRICAETNILLPDPSLVNL